jgi:hypothetical protein
MLFWDRHFAAKRFAQRQACKKASVGDLVPHPPLQSGGEMKTITTSLREFLSICSVVILAGAAACAQIPATFFGMHHNHLISSSQPWAVGPGSTPISGSVRAWDMDGTRWFELNPSNSTYTWTNLDNLISQAQAHNTEILYTFGWTPSWAIGSQTCWNPGYGGTACANVPDSMTYWDNFLTAIATHAKGKIKYYEIWNEPNVLTSGCSSNPCPVGTGMFWNGKTSQEDIADLITMTQHAQSIIKSIDPSALIVTPAASTGDCSTGTYVHPNCWLNDFLSAGGGAYVDAISFHGYPGSASPLPITTIANELSATMSNWGQSGKPLFDTESSQCNSNTTADFVGQFELLHVFSPVTRHYWYAWENGSCGPLWSSAGGLNSGGQAYAQIYDWIVGSTKTQASCTVNGAVYTCGLRLADGRAGLAVWNTAGTSSFTPASQYTQYKDLLGNTRNVTGSVSISTQPLLLVGSGTAPNPPTSVTTIVH